MSCEELFIQQLRQRGFRFTPQREMVLVVLHQVNHPATAEEIFTLVAEKSSSVEISTVYRTLDLLHSLNMLEIIERSDKQRLYRLAVQEAPHLHLVCRVCGSISGVEMDLLIPFIQHAKENLHFTPDFSGMTISGICNQCQEQEQEN